MIRLLAVLLTASLAHAAGLELNLQSGHAGSVTCTAQTAKVIVTGSGDRTAILWTPAGEKLRSFAGHTNSVMGVSLSADGTRLATASEDKTAILWNALTGEKLRTFIGHTASISSVTLAPDGKTLVTGSHDGTAVLWNDAGEKVRTFTHAANVNSIARRGDLLICGCGDKTAVIWDVRNGDKKHTLAHADIVMAVAISGDGKVVATGGLDGAAQTWNAATGAKIGDAVRHKAHVYSVSLDATGARLVTGSKDATAMIWQNGQPLRTLAGHASQIVGVSFSPEGDRVVTASSDRTAIVWNVTTGERLRTLAGKMPKINGIALSAEGAKLATASNDGTASLWSLASGEKARTFIGHRNWVQGVALNTDGSRLATVSLDRTAKLWNTATGETLKTFAGHEDWLKGVALSADAATLATSTFETVRVWSTATGATTQVYAKTDGLFFNVALSPDGKRLVTCSLSGGIWNAGSGEKIAGWSGHALPLKCATFSADGRSIATGAMDKSAILWSAAGEKQRTFAGHTAEVLAVALTPDAGRLVTGSADGTAILWDTATGNNLQTFSGHTAEVSGVALTADGTRLITGSYDGTVRLWDAATGKELCTLFAPDAGREWLVTTPEGLFDGSPDAPRYLSYRIAGTNDLVPLDRYQQKYWTPGLLAKLWKGERPVPKIDIAKNVPPAVSLTNIKPGMQLNSAKLTVNVTGVSRSGHPITAFRMLLDGRPYQGQKGVLKLDKPALGDQLGTFDIELDPGKHTLKVLADTEFVQGASDEVEVVYAGGGAAVELPTLNVLAIGVSEHGVPSRRLDYAAADASAVAAAFQQHSRTLYKNVDVKLILDTAATRKEIFKGLQWLRERAKPNSVSVVFFAGHGEKDAKDGTLYFLPYDSEEKDFAGSAIEADTLKKQLASIPGRLMLVLDACHSGAIGAEKTRGTDLTDQLLRDLVAEESGLAVLCSALGNQKAQESRQHGHGMFTQALLEGLSGRGNGEAGDRLLKPRTVDGGVYLGELNAYVGLRVRQLTKGYQSPVFGTPRFLRDFPLSKP